MGILVVWLYTKPIEPKAIIPKEEDTSNVSFGPDIEFPNTDGMECPKC